MKFRSFRCRFGGTVWALATALSAPLQAAPDSESAVRAAASGVDNLLPLPVEVSRCEGSLVLPAVITYRRNSGNPPGARLARALSRLGTESAITLEETGPALLELTIIEAASAYPRVDTDESYRLNIDTKGIQLSAATEYGALHGLSTLGQLMQSSKTLECVSIVDRPRFAWRGLLLDVVRHWMPLDVVKRQIDAMALYKMNVLHWHLSDDQGFRVESLKHPALHVKGSDGHYYTQAQVRDVVEYAADRGVRVVPEFDLPGHSRSWQMAYPQLSSVPGKQFHLYHQDGFFSDPLDPTSEANLQLISEITGEMSALFPDAYFHMGGDEVSTDAWEDNPRIQAFMEEHHLADEHALQAWFIAHYEEMLQGLGKIPIGWDEVAGEQYPPDAIVNKWRTLEYTADEKRNPIVLSAGFYLDHMHTAWWHYRNDPEQLPGARGAHVLGGEASAWAESIDPVTVDMRIWPRTLAIAELLWSPADATSKQTEVQLYRRLQTHSERLQGLGLNHLSHSSNWFVSLLGTERAEPVLTLASVSRPEMFAFFVTTLPRLIRWPWNKTLYDEPLQLNAFIDHLPPESLTAWHFNQAVERYLRQRSDEDRDTLRQQLLRWRDNHAVLLSVLAQSPELNDIDVAPLSLALKELAEAGLAALEALDTGQALQSSEPAKVVRRYDFTDPQLPSDWFEHDILRVRNLFRPLILLQVKLPVQRGVARLVEVADLNS